MFSAQSREDSEPIPKPSFHVERSQASNDSRERGRPNGSGPSTDPPPQEPICETCCNSIRPSRGRVTAHEGTTTAGAVTTRGPINCKACNQPLVGAPRALVMDIVVDGRGNHYHFACWQTTHAPRFRRKQRKAVKRQRGRTGSIKKTTGRTRRQVRRSRRPDGS